MHFWTLSVTKREKTCFQKKKLRLFDKRIIKNVQNELFNKKKLRIYKIKWPIGINSKGLILRDND